MMVKIQKNCSMDKTLTEIVKDTPNDMELGKKIRELYFKQQEDENIHQ